VRGLRGARGEDRLARRRANSYGPHVSDAVEKEKGEGMEWAARDEMWRWSRNEGRGRDKFFPFSFSCSILF
jgi:hypothetical protein